MKKLLLAVAAAGLVASVSLPANAFWGSWGGGPWYGGPWGGGPWWGGGYPYGGWGGYPGYGGWGGYPGWGGWGGGYPYGGWGGYPYGGWGYPYATALPSVTVAPAAPAATSDK